MKKFFAGFFAMAVLSLGQNPQQPNGFATEWDLRKLLSALSAGTQRVQPILQRADPKNWRDAAAGQAYMQQWKTAQNEIQYLASSTDTFSKQPERLTVALETYFRLDSVERTLASFADGLKRHGNSAVADLLEATMHENAANRDHLRQYLSELAQTKEQESKIMDAEAQRCRASLSKQPPARLPRK